jgi:ABC-type taurine transport system substrate-binding protein
MFSTKEKTIFGFIIIAIVSFIIGLNVGIEGQKKFEKNLDTQFSKPVFDAMQADYQNVVSQWKECRDELFEYRKVTGFMKPTEYDSLNKLKTQLIREKMDAVEQAYIAASNAKAIEDAIKRMDKKSSE